MTDGIPANCFVCTDPMTVKGAVLTSSPLQTSSDNVDTVSKFHICGKCELNVMNFMIGKVHGVEMPPKLALLQDLFEKGNFVECQEYIKGLIELCKTGEKEGSLK